MVVTTPLATFRRRSPEPKAVRWVGDVESPGGVHGDEGGIGQLGGAVEPPATVVMTPFETLRMRLLYVSAM